MSSCTLLGLGGEEVEKNSYPPKWEHNFDVGYFASINPIIFKDKVIYSALDEKKNDFSANSTLESFEKESGEVSWTWDENMRMQNEKFSRKDGYHIYNDVLYISSGWEYAIDLNNGITLFDNNHNKANGVSFFGDNNLIFTNFTTSDNSYESIEYTYGDNFQWKVLLERINKDTSIYYYQHALFDNNIPDRIYFPYTRWNGNESRPHILIYDFENKLILLDNPIEIVEGNHFIDNIPILNGDKIFLTIHGLVACIEKNTGELLWETKVNGNTSSSGIIFPENNLLYVNTEFGVYCLDPETGSFIWSEVNGEKEGNSSRMQYHNGVIYYIGGGRFHARDANTGEQLLFFEAPSFANDAGAFFQPVMTIDHESDRIYTASYTHAYCYPTLR